MEQRYRVTAATGALEPVISKLTNLLDDRAEFAHLERWREDIQFVKSRLSSMYSLLLTIWDREDLRLDSACNEWMADARKLSYSVEEDIDSGVFADSSAFTQPKTDAVNPFEKLKNEVQKLINRCSEDWKTLGRTISEHPQPAEPNVDPIMSEFIHHDASELVEMDEKKYQLIRLLEEHHTVCIVGFAGMGKTTLADQVYQGIGKKFESHAFVSLSRRPNVTRVLTSLCTQVMVSAITNKRKVVTDSLADTVALEWDSHYSSFIKAIKDILCEDVLRKANDEQKKDTETLNKLQEEENMLINNIKGFFGREVTGNTQLQGTGAEDKLIMSVAVFFLRKEWKARVDDHNKYLKKIISKLLEDKRYLVIVDDIWDWKDWECIRNDTLPKINNSGSRIISTTRYKGIAEKYQMDNNSFVYEIAGLSPVAASALSKRVLMKSGKVNNFQCDINGPCSSIAKVTSGMPLAIICMSSAVAEQLSVQDGQALDHKWFHVAESRALEGILTIPGLRPFVESFSHVYHELPLHLKTCLLHCCIYPPHHIFGRNDLIRIWIAEGFVQEEEEAQSYIDELINKGFIWPYSSTTITEKVVKYEMNVMMLHFLIKCKSHEDYFLASPDCWSDLSRIPAIPPVRRLCIQCYHYKVDISDQLHMSDIHILYVFDYTWISSLKHFEHLQMLYLHGGHLTNADLEDICGLVGLRWLSLRVELINLLPKEIQRLQNLKTLDVSNTGILGLPKEIGELKCLETLDVSNTMLTELPMEIWRLQQMKTLDAGGTHIREVSKEIGKLVKLETLDLRSTMITVLPKEIGELLCLKTLNLRHTFVRELPKETGELQHLETLDVSGTMLKELPNELLGKLMKHLKTLNISSTLVRELPWEAGGISNTLSVLVEDSDPPKALTLLNKDVRRPWNEGTSSAENCRDKLSITVFDHFGSSKEPLPFARFKIGERHIGVPELVKTHLRNICSLEISVWKLEKEDFKFLGEMPKLHALALQLELRTRDPITITSTGFLELESFSIDCRAPRITFHERAMLKLKYLNFKFYACLPTEHPMGIKHLQSLKSITFRCGSPRYGSDAPGINAVINEVRKQAQENPNRITFCVNDNEQVYPEKAIKLFEENGESTIIIDGAGSSSATGVETSLFSNDTDEEGKITSVGQ